MKLRPLLAVLPAIALLKLTACSDNGNDQPGGGNPPVEAGPGNDGNMNPQGDGGGDGGPMGPRGSCTVSQAGTAGLLFKGRLLLPDAPTDGELLVDASGIIQCAAASCAATPAYADDTTYKALYASATQVTCTNAVISPGLINPHDHISYANTPPQPHGTERYDHRHDWRKGLEGHAKINAPGGAKTTVMLAQELRFLMTGTTAAAGASGAAGLVRNVDTSTANLEAGLRLKLVDSDTFPLDDSTPPQPFPPQAPTGAYDTSLCSIYKTARDTTTTIASYDGFLPHMGEGVNEAARREIECQSDSADPTHQLFAKQTAIIHGVGATAIEVGRMHQPQTSLIWSPRSNVDLYGNTAPVVLYDNLGVQIALGTDWLPSGSMNFSRELKCADDLNKTYFAKHFTDRQLWQMVTFNAAFAIGAQNALGQLKAGYSADIAIFSTNPGADYRAVIESSPEDVIGVFRGGQALYGDKDFLAQKGLNADQCEDLDVCGIAHKACVKQDTGSSDLATVTADGTAVYPLFACRGMTPMNEPSCVPTRPAASPAVATSSIYTGIPDGTDKDGDGIPDAMDNCPDVFNPVRPLDVDKQADTDGDGIGDACDKCPNDPGETCTPPSSDDLDDDGVPNAVDNCPEVANPDQADQDHDGKGDLCDVGCETTPNPGQTLCPVTYTIPTLRNPAAPGHPTAGSVRAKITGVYVTGLRLANTTSAAATDLGFYVQSDTAAYSGLYVQTGTIVPTVKIGNKVDVEGDYDEVFNVTTLLNPTITVTDSGTTVPFAPYQAATGDISNVPKGADGPLGEMYESMLCAVGPVTVDNMNPDAPSDFDEFTVKDATSTPSLRVDDYLYPPLDNTFAVGTTFTTIIGVCGYSFNERKIYPRSAADLTSP